jgi:uncharacterized membrane protein
MYALHPFTVHFPLALLLISSFFTLLALSRGDAWGTSAYHCLLIGWLAAVVALLTGTFDAVRQLVGPEAPRDNTLIGWVNAHAIANLAATVVYGQALLRRRRQPAILDNPDARRGYLRLHALGAALLLIGGWVGGQLVYAFGMGLRP